MEPPVHPRVGEESPEAREARYQNIRDGFNFFDAQLRQKKPDCVILVGDDQDENFREDNLPQIAVYTGSTVWTNERGPNGTRERGRLYQCHPEFARELLNGLVERDFDMASCSFFPNDELLSHAHSPILRRVVPDADIPVVPVFLNAIHVPAISPGRCYRLGQAVREIVGLSTSVQTVAVYASGGLSHFTAGYPWKHYRGSFTLGSISEEFDRKAVDAMRRGEGDKLVALTSQDLLDNGAVEMRSWIFLLGALGNVRPQFLHYEPFYSAVMAMGIGYWEGE